MILIISQLWVKQWNLYCAISANAFAEDVGSFTEFKEIFTNSSTGGRPKQTEQTMNDTQIKVQVEKANKILNGFVPPLKGGG